jgi:hypothetical protein
MTLYKESYLRQKLKTVYNQLQFYSKIIKNVKNNFFISSKKIKTIYKKQVATMQPLPTFTSKGCKSYFSISSIKHQNYTIYSADKYKFYLYNFPQKLF